MSTTISNPPSAGRWTRFPAWLLAIVLFIPVLVGLGAPVPTLAQEGTPSAATEPAADDSVIPEPPPVSAAAVFALDASIDAPLYARNPDEHLPPASLVKMMTALLVREHAALDETVVVDAADEVDTERFSHMGLVAGDTVTVEQLLYGLLVPSGNDAANALARHVGAKLAAETAGDPAAAVAAFVAAMNQRAADLGLANSRFRNPSGEDDPEQYSCARDLAALAKTVMIDDKLAEIVDTPTYATVSVGPEQRPYGDGGVLYNTNTLIQEPGVHGVKTGTTAAAGGNLVTATYFLGNNRIIVVVLGSPYEADPATGQATVDERYPATVNLLNAMDADYRWFDPAAPGTVPGLDEEMAAWQVTMRQGPAVVVPTDRLEEFRYALRLGPPGEPDAEVGKVLFFVGDRPIGERPLYQT